MHLNLQRTCKDDVDTDDYTVEGFYSAGAYCGWNWLIGLVGRVFVRDPGDLGSIPSHVIPKTFKMVLDISLLNTQQYKVRIKGKVEQRSSALSYTSV